MIDLKTLFEGYISTLSEDNVKVVYNFHESIMMLTCTKCQTAFYPQPSLTLAQNGVKVFCEAHQHKETSGQQSDTNTT